MSRLTAIQIVAQGDYLDPDFDPSTLTVSQLIGVLGYHDIAYPTPPSKSKLIQTFISQLKPRVGEFRKDRIVKELSQASEDGITDGITGEPLSEAKKEPVRRSSRRLSRAPSEAKEVSPTRQETPKRRRSSAQPGIGRPSRKSKIEPTDTILIEESEPEDDHPVRKVGRSQKNTDAGTHSRRVSKTIVKEETDSDIEITPHARQASPRMRPRRSIAPRRSRKSASAPPDLSPSTTCVPRSRTKPSAGPSPLNSTFAPQLPDRVKRETELMAAKFSSDIQKSPFNAYVPEPDNISAGELDEIYLEETANSGDDGTHTDDPDAKQIHEVQRRLAGQGRAQDLNVYPIVKSGLSPFYRLCYVVGLVLSLYLAMNYKLESLPIGFCERGKNTNAVLEEKRAMRIAVDLCNKENRTLLYPNGDDLTPCPPPPLMPFIPDSCTPCPEHASCAYQSLECDSGHLLRSHPLFFFLSPVSSPPNTTITFSSPPTEVAWRLISLTNGLPGFGSVAFPPTCVEDPRRKKHIGAIGRAMERDLAHKRGERLCSGEVDNVIYLDQDGGEARRWGINLNELLRDKIDPTNDLFNEAVQQLLQWGGVIIGEDSSGNRYLAHKTPELSWSCAITVKARNMWARWRLTVIGLGAIVVAMYWTRLQQAKRSQELKRVADMVQMALEVLKNQELGHHADPVSISKPFLSSVQLRDVILQDEHSVSTRRRLWDQVERVVEGNANVRTNVEEVDGGDEQRVWRWVGSSVRPRLSMN